MADSSAETEKMALLRQASRLRIALEDVAFAAREAARALGTAPAEDIARATERRLADRYIDALDELRMLEQAISACFGRK